MAAGEPATHRHRADWTTGQDGAATPAGTWGTGGGWRGEPAAGRWHGEPAGGGWRGEPAGAGGWRIDPAGTTPTSTPNDREEDELPIVAAYMVTRGRVAATPYNRTATVYGRPGDTAAVYGLDPAHLRVLDIVNARPSAVAEIAGLMNVPVVAVRVLLDELVGRRLVAVTGPDGPPPTPAILTRALSGLRTI
ncbi:hypothetical protein Athai_38360 [Actinocatenispora thailandica]|uniref:DUF742 domain-containing protein n=1 Tax=Actinocatenispora thailandica TaxID=227318 RepID=A0A7R7HXU4_9ACTN|nr:DUF742 domain-containing protein [Actinocatenispora thailandica]BCJ36333.1 hypothetical protein Athai_38360 [Actinocatenispora thailandica]